MTLIMGLDIAWDRPTIDSIKGTGARWVARYLSTDPSKNWTAAEVHQYTGSGLGCVFVWETTATRALDGRGAGAADATSALRQLQALGVDGYRQPVYFTVDTDTNWSAVKAYFDGVTSVHPHELVGVYGSYQIVLGARMYGLGYRWQTVAWSHGLRDSGSHILQTGAQVLRGAGDVDYAYESDYGQYPRPAAPTPAPRAFHEEDVMFIHALDSVPESVRTDPMTGAQQVVAEVVKDAICQVGPGTRYWLGPRAWAGIIIAYKAAGSTIPIASVPGETIQANWPMLLGRGD